MNILNGVGKRLDAVDTVAW